MMTNRPDKIDIDLKRPGRLDNKIPFFLPEDENVCLAILKAQIRKHQVELVEGIDWEEIKPRLKGYSAAEIEAVLLAAVRVAVVESDADYPVIDIHHLHAASKMLFPLGI